MNVKAEVKLKRTSSGSEEVNIEVHLNCVCGFDIALEPIACVVTLQTLLI